MGEVKMSGFLQSKKPLMKELQQKLQENYKYVSILGTDTTGKAYEVKQTGVSINDSMWVERGFVIRVYNGINYSEYSFSQLKPELIDGIVKEVNKLVEKDLRNMEESLINISHYPIIEEKVIKKSYQGQVDIFPGDMSAEEKISRMDNIKEKGLALSEAVVDFRVMYEDVHVSKIFISGKKDLEQSYVWSQGMMLALGRKNEKTKYYYEGFSGLKGPELLDEMAEEYKNIVESAEALLDAHQIEPGVYDVICAPDVAGVIAHEAFGHGVETDMFIKNRAKAVDFINKPVASKLVDMYDGATAARHVSSYLFDDEGTPGSETVIIENGILKKGLSDQLSALKLGVEPTGNGKRESFERKAYARMTNTFFGPGKDKLEEMIANIDEGYLLEKVMSGMEDPKNWGIQCMVLVGKEIKDGKLTGKIVSPVVMTGYVPDVLKSIDMISDEIELGGSGYCGKGYKEYVKVSSGGPYIKAKVRLG